MVLSFQISSYRLLDLITISKFFISFQISSYPLLDLTTISKFLNSCSLHRFLHMNYSSL